MKKIILITGSTDGIGKLTAIKLAKEGHEIILHGRNAEKLTSTVSEIKTISNNERVNGFVGDFSDLKAVQNMAEKLKDVYTKIDVLINNAGILNSEVSTTKDGLNICFAVNYFAPYVLTNMLLPLLKNSNEPRIINLSSAAQATVLLDALAGKKSIAAQSAYAQSKLALTIWSFALAKKEKEIVVIAVNPGSLLNTKMVREAYGQHWSSADKGMNILYDLSLSKNYKDTSGKYFDNDKGEEKGFFAPAHPDAYQQNKIDALLEATEKILKQ